MTKARLFSRFSLPAMAIYIVAAIRMLSSGFYAGLRVEEPELFVLLVTIVWLWTIGWWLMGDLRKQRRCWVYCPGLFLNFAWPVLLPYYLLKTRGARAMIPIGIMVAISIGTSMIGATIGVALTID